MPGLDGLRALAVLAVIAYHLGLVWAPGGLLGVGVFFTLSGYLITDLLLAQWARGRGRLGLADFWLRRARRLLPALFLMLVVVTVWVSIADRSQMPTVRGQVGAATVYVSNWWQIFQHMSYFARFGPPSPLNHLWSLAVEEQFYLFWPWILLLGVTCVRERKRPIQIRPDGASLGPHGHAGPDDGQHRDRRNPPAAADRHAASLTNSRVTCAWSRGRGRSWRWRCWGPA